jgi:hypothetical protein
VSIGDRLGRAQPWLAGAAMLALVCSCLPFALQTIHQVDVARRPDGAGARRCPGAALDRRGAGRGGVLTSSDLGYAAPGMPGMPGRQTSVGHPMWAPNGAKRAAVAGALFAGTLTPGPPSRPCQARARFVLEPYGSPADLPGPLASLGYRRRSIGCATRYTAG